MTLFTISRNRISPYEIRRATNLNNSIQEKWIRTTKRIRFMNLLKLPSETPSEDFIAGRSMKFENIFLNKCTDEVKLSSILYCFLGIFLGVVFTAFITIFPQHYAIGISAYWYEPMLVLLFSWGPIAAVQLINVCSFCMGIEGKNTIQTCCLAYVVGSSSSCILSYFLYLLWTNIVKLPYPMPFHGYIIAVVTWYSMNIVFWFQCPKTWRSDHGSTKKMIFCILFLNMLYIAEITYKAIRKTFLLVPRSYHLPLVLVLIIVREWHGWSIGYLGKKIAGYPDISIEILATLIGGLRHIMFLSVDIGSITNELVSYSILAADFVINLIFCLLVVWYNRKWSRKNQEKQVKAIMSLIINESLEFLMPIAYVICLLMAYYGPNAEILGNIKNSYWQYIEINNIEKTLQWIGMMFVVDVASAVISFIVLWWLCKINILRIYLQVQNEIWYIIAIQQGYLISEVKR